MLSFFPEWLVRLLPLMVIAILSGEVIQAADPSRIYAFRPLADGASLSLIADENTIPDREFLGSPVASHDGNWVLFDATKGRSFAKTRLVKVAIAGPDKGKVVDLGYGVCASFSPDDSQIAFFLNNNVPSGEERGVWIMNADGSERERIGSGCHPKWSPDGSTILAVNRFLSPRYLTGINLETRKQTRLLKNEVVLGQPAWSPNGKKIAVTVKDGEDRVLCIFRPEVEPTDRTELWRQPFSQVYDETWPDWSPDGKSIVFTVWDKDVGGILIVDLVAEPGKNLRKANVAPATEPVRDSCWAADGKRVLFASASRAIHTQATTPQE